MALLEVLAPARPGQVFRGLILPLARLTQQELRAKLDTTEAVKVLAAIATIFIPLSFFTGPHGMNFEFVPEPELGYPWAYPALPTFMAAALGWFSGELTRSPQNQGCP